MSRLTTLLLKAWAVLLVFSAVPVAAESGRHLFILSGQSNMQGHRPEEAFTPAVARALGEDRVIVVQDAQGGQPIRRWRRDWKSPDGEPFQGAGDLYDRLLKKVAQAIDGKQIKSVTFIWMQGERDARMTWGGVYEESLRALYTQICQDLKRQDAHFVIGRLSDFDMANARYPHWTMIRDIQVKVADSDPRFAWVDTDDLNDGVNRQGKSISNDLHYSAEGYRKLGERFADAALKLLRATSAPANRSGAGEGR